MNPHSIMWVKMWIEESDRLAPILALSLPGCVTWGKLLNISDPQFSYL